MKSGWMSSALTVARAFRSVLSACGLGGRHIPVGIGQLQEKRIPRSLLRCSSLPSGADRTGQGGRENGPAAYGIQSQKTSTIDHCDAPEGLMGRRDAAPCFRSSVPDAARANSLRNANKSGINCPAVRYRIEETAHIGRNGNGNRKVAGIQCSVRSRNRGAAGLDIRTQQFEALVLPHLDAAYNLAR
jgi:hypothetical protein